MSAGLSAELKGILGDDGFVALAEAFGGTRLYVPYKMHADHDIARAVGLERAERLSRRYSPAYLRVPLAREERAVQYRVHGLSNPQIARKLGVNESSIDKLFAKLESRPVKGSAQLSLFND